MNQQITLLIQAINNKPIIQVIESGLVLNLFGNDYCCVHCEDHPEKRPYCTHKSKVLKAWYIINTALNLLRQDYFACEKYLIFKAEEHANTKKENIKENKSW